MGEGCTQVEGSLWGKDIAGESERRPPLGLCAGSGVAPTALMTVGWFPGTSQGCEHGLLPSPSLPLLHHAPSRYPNSHRPPKPCAGMSTRIHRPLDNFWQEIREHSFKSFSCEQLNQAPEFLVAVLRPLCRQVSTDGPPARRGPRRGAAPQGRGARAPDSSPRSRAHSLLRKSGL